MFDEDLMFGRNELVFDKDFVARLGSLALIIPDGDAHADDADFLVVNKVVPLLAVEKYVMGYS